MTKRADIFKVLAVENRIRIIELLKRKGALCVNAITRDLGITQSAVSQHLRILRQLNLLRNERKGYWIHYSLNEAKLEQCRSILNMVCSCGCLGARSKTDKRWVGAKNRKELQRYKARLEKELMAVELALEKRK